MRKGMFLTVIAMAMCCMMGCGGGGGSSNNNGNTFTIQDTATRFNPKTTTMSVANSAQFINVDSQPHMIVSGTLEPQGNPLNIHTIVIGNTGFSPSTLQTNLGDTIQFSNNQTNPFNLDILDDNGAVISSLTIGTGLQQTFTFPGAGIYVLQSHNNSAFRGTVTLFGRPNPDGVFQSPVLNNGGTFLVQFNTTGSFPFFDENINNPNQSFKTGTINVQ